MVMESLPFKKFIQNIEDYVFIEDKIVTCVWLSQTLKVHINTAKQLLYAFLQEENVKNKVVVTYILGGVLKNNGGMQLRLVEGSRKEEAKDLFSTLTTDHVYSIQKSAEELKMTNIYNSFPHFNLPSEDRDLCLVKPHQKVEKREVKQFAVETRKEIPQPALKESKPSEKIAAMKRVSSNDAQEPPSKKKSPDKNKVTKGGIADMFSKQNDRKKTEPAKISGISEKVEKKPEKKKSGGISDFLQKQPSNKVSVEGSVEVIAEPSPIKETNKKIVTNKKPEARKNEVKNDSEKSSAKEKKLKGKENKKKRKKRDEKEEDSRKKRKRIAVFSSDSESSENERSDFEMEADLPPPSEPIPKDNVEEDIIPPTPGRKRVRKQIDKTFTDEDGFILTEKEYVYESCTDDEGTEEKKGEAEKKPVHVEKPKTIKTDDKKITSSKKKSPTSDKSNNKQSSIMSFFKKK